jgi:hypothetical protein
MMIRVQTTKENMSDQVEYQVEEPTTTKGLWSKRWVRVTAITVGAAVALGGSFGLGVIAGHKLSDNNIAGHSGQFDDHNFGGPNGQFTKGQGGLPGQNGFQGGCPANDPDHCAGTDRNQHDFQVPNGSAGSESINPSALPTPAANS